MSKGIGGIKGYHGGGGVTHTHGPKNKKKKTTTTPDTSAYQQAAASGYMGAGYTPAKDRLKQSKKDSRYIAPGAGGTIVTTGRDGISKREDYDATATGGSGDNIVKTTFVDTSGTGTGDGGTGDGGTGDGTDTEGKTVNDYEYYLLPNGNLDIRKVRRNKSFFENITGKKIANITADGTIIFQDQTQGIGQLKLVDLLGGALDKLTGFNPNKALTKGGMGDQGKAALFHKLSGMDPEQFREFLNRKGNLDRIREFSGDMSPKAMADFEAQLKAASSTGGAGGQFFANMIASTGGKDFEMLKLKNSPDKADKERYWKLNPPRTQGDLEEAAMAGISYIDGYGPVERPDSGGSLQGGGGGIGNVTPDPTPDLTPTNVPDFLLKRQYMPNFTPSYLGGPEQMQVAGGYYDPTAKKFIGDPYGTASQYQFPPPPIQRPVLFSKGGIVGTSPLLFKNQGGMANDKGIKSFKKYGY